VLTFQEGGDSWLPRYNVQVHYYCNMLIDTTRQGRPSVRPAFSIIDVNTTQ
jgi:hypothetical protein